MLKVNLLYFIIIITIECVNHIREQLTYLNIFRHN